VVLTLVSGKTLAGIVQAEDKESLTLMTQDGTTVKIQKKEIDEQTQATSAMPSMERALSLRELRDLIEYLMILK
jgi:putative heme-binding domain-containing protein